MGSVPCNDGNNNYKYDEIGNLTKDNQEEIEEIKWRVDGKIAEIKRGSGSNKQNLVFNYDIVSLSIDYILGAGFVKVTKALIPISRKLIPNTSFKEGATHITTPSLASVRL